VSTKKLNSLLFLRVNEMRYRTVICPFSFFCEEACGEFTVLPVIVKAFTAFILPLTRLVGACAEFFEFLLYAFHDY
jgi:hypothetical protein